jgi:sulfonate transport system permease protein
MSDALRRVALGALGALIVLALWQGIVSFHGLERIVLPPPGEVVSTLMGLVATRAFWRDVGVSLFEFISGYLAGGIAGILVGALMGESRRFRDATTPIVESLRFIVPFAWIPLTILWFGTSFTGKILLVAYAVFFVMVVSTMRAVAGVDPTLTRVGTMLGMSRRALAFKVHLPAAVPVIASAARAAAAIGWIAVVAAEYVGASAGLGVMITNAATSLATAVVIAGMVVIGVIGAGVSALVGTIARFGWGMR